jgi:hypothetical protein
MSGLESAVIDVVNQAAPSYATATIAQRGLSSFLDPGLTGTARFFKKAGFPFPLLTPMVTSPILNLVGPGIVTVTITGTELQQYLRQGIEISLELFENHLVSSWETTSTGNTAITMSTPAVANHNAGTLLYITSFPVTPVTTIDIGDGDVGTGSVDITSPFILVAGDVLKLPSNESRTILSAELLSLVSGLYTYAVLFTEGSPEVLTTADLLYVKATPAYQSKVLTLPQADLSQPIMGPCAVDFVSGPIVSDYLPRPDYQLFIEEFAIDNREISPAYEVRKNDTLSRLQISRDQMLFWKVLDGSLNWDGSYVHLIANTDGYAGVFTPIRPPLDSAPITIKRTVVPSFSPYRVSTQPRIQEDSVTVQLALTDAEVDGSLYTVDPVTGNIDFDSSMASVAVVVKYRPRISWQITVVPLEADITVNIKVGTDDKVSFPLTTANVPYTLTVDAGLQDDVGLLAITANRTDNSAGRFTVKLGDWTPSTSQVAAIRYVISTPATLSYGWASSGLMIKPLWPCLSLLQATLDGTGMFATMLDSGKILGS